ncbi:MAG: hypothetical protein AAFN30_08165, partial [Actinomycetota bacterium]
LAQRGILTADGENPVARTNVAPEAPAVAETELHAFGFTAPGSAATMAGVDGPSFVISGAGDLHDQADLRPTSIVGGDGSWAETGAERATAVIDEIERRLSALGLPWEACDEVVLYAIDDVGSVLRSVVAPRLGSTARRGVRWHQAAPPIQGLRFEMDARGGVLERRR